jgi:hypothetical protein
VPEVVAASSVNVSGMPGSIPVVEIVATMEVVAVEEPEPVMPVIQCWIAIICPHCLITRYIFIKVYFFL